jgi:uncharacterized protein YabE (DUF348 family)
MTYRVRYENGQEVSRTPVSRTVLAPSRPAVVIEGTRPRPNG